jgi:hypothetical protein
MLLLGSILSEPSPRLTEHDDAESSTAKNANNRFVFIFLRFLVSLCLFDVAKLQKVAMISNNYEL